MSSLANIDARAQNKVSRQVHYASTSGLSMRKVAQDVAEGAARWELWGMLAYSDIRHRYQRSVLGPFWLTLSMGVMIGTMGFVYARLFHTLASAYLPFLTLGFITWGLVSGIVIDSCTVFTGSEGIIRQVRAPYSTQVFRMLWRNLIVLAHNMLIYVLIIALYAIQPGYVAVLAVPALVLICLNGLWLGMLLGALSARFRDLPPIVFNVMQIFFYITPIVWKPNELAAYPAIVALNPIHYFVELLRAPLLGTVPPLATWLVVCSITVLGSAGTFVFLARFRGRIAYWL